MFIIRPGQDAGSIWLFALLLSRFACALVDETTMSTISLLAVNLVRGFAVVIDFQHPPNTASLRFLTHFPPQFSREK